MNTHLISLQDLKEQAGELSGQLQSPFGESFSWQGGIWSWLMSLLIPVITILMLLMIALCIINCLTHFVPAQVNKLQHAVPVQQGYIKLQPAMENITHPQMDTAIRTLRLETSKKGRPNTPCHPSSAGSSQKDLDAPIPKELGLPSIEGECQVVRIGKRSPEWQCLKDKKGKSPQKQNTGGSEDRSENLR